MSVDFLGRDTKKKPAKAKKKTLELKMHLPEELQKPKEVKVKKTEKVPIEKEFKEVNFVAILKEYLFKKQLFFSVIFAIIIIVILGGGGYYYFFLYEPALPVVNRPVVIASPTPTLVVSPASPTPSPSILASPKISPSPIPQPSVTPIPTPPPGPLPDTELAPLRGALVKFKDETVIYLIEENGELRKVDQQTVIFDNGKRIDQISSSLIYTIADRFKDVRRGKDVFGQVDWDPRVLNFSELNPFL